MKQEKHEIRCSKIEKRLGKYCFFEKSYKNTRTKEELFPVGDSSFLYIRERTRTISIKQSGGLFSIPGSTGIAPF